MAVIRAPIDYAVAGPSAIAQMLMSVPNIQQAYFQGQRTHEDEQRQRRQEEEQRQMREFDVQQQVQQAQLEAAAQTPESKLRPLVMPEFTIDPQTQQMVPKDESLPAQTTKAVKIPGFLGGGEIPGRPILSLEDVRKRKGEEYREEAKAKRAAEEELGDRVEVTQELLDSLGPLKAVYQPMLGKSVRREDVGSPVFQMWRAKEEDRQRLEAEARAKTERIETEKRGEAADIRGERRRADLALDTAQKKAGITSEIPPEKRKRFEDSTVSDWRDFTTDNLNASDFSTRTGITKNEAKMLAQELGKKIPDQSTAKITLAAKADLADIKQIKELMSDPEVKEWVGAYAGRIVDWQSMGWLDPITSFFGSKPPVPDKVFQFRSTLNSMGAKKRHDIYGAAVTATEIPFAEAFIPSIRQGIQAMEASVNEAEDSIVRGLDAMWGTSPSTGAEKAAGGGAAAPANDPLGIR